MRAYLGIRRRLAPLLENDRDRIELFTALLLSLPGSPIMYYGDEIGMGDNIWLEDRDAVRTPMQWSPDRNAGFSSADPGRLYLPAVMDPIYGFQAVNVEAQQRSEGSLLHFTRRMLEIRRSHPVFGLGAYTEMWSSNNQRAHLRPRVRRRRHAVREQPVEVSPAGGARPAPLHGHDAGGGAGRGALPP